MNPFADAVASRMSNQGSSTNSNSSIVVNPTFNYNGTGELSQDSARRHTKDMFKNIEREITKRGGRLQ